MLAVRSQMPDVIQMVVRDQHGLEGIDIKAILCQSLLQTPLAHSRIDEKPGSAVGKEIAIAAAAAGKTKKPQHHFFSSSQYFEITL